MRSLFIHVGWVRCRIVVLGKLHSFKAVLGLAVPVDVRHRRRHRLEGRPVYDLGSGAEARGARARPPIYAPINYQTFVGEL